MKYALDSSTVSYALRSDGRVGDHLRRIGPAALVLPTMVVFEVRFGLLRMGHHRFHDAFVKMVEAMGTIDLDVEAAAHAAAIRVDLELRGTPIGLADLLIAATARRHGCTLVTHNTREFSRVPELNIEDWY